MKIITPHPADDAQAIERPMRVNPGQERPIGANPDQLLLSTQAGSLQLDDSHKLEPIATICFLPVT